MNQEVKQAKEPLSDPPKFLTVEEVAEMLRIKVRTVHEMVSPQPHPLPQSRTAHRVSLE